MTGHDGRGGVLGLYLSPEVAARATQALRAAGFRGSDMDVLSDAPYPEGTFGEDAAGHHLFVFPLAGAACGLVVGLLLTVAVQVAYPMVQGGKPLLSIPPMVNVVFEGTLLGAIVFTVIGVVFESRLPDFGGDPYDPRICEGMLGVLVVRVGERSAARAEEVLRSTGAVDVVIHRPRHSP